VKPAQSQPINQKQPKEAVALANEIANPMKNG
jgi:hypothetical protein